MGNCTYCGKSAGLLRKKHPDCEKQHHERERVAENGRIHMVNEVGNAIKGTANFDELEGRLSTIERNAFLPRTDRRMLLIKGWEKTVEKFLEDGILDDSEESRLVQFKERFGLSQAELDKNGAFSATAKAAILREILNGTIPQRVAVAASRMMPIPSSNGSNDTILAYGTRRLFSGPAK